MSSWSVACLSSVDDSTDDKIMPNPRGKWLVSLVIKKHTIHAPEKVFFSLFLGKKREKNPNPSEGSFFCCTDDKTDFCRNVGENLSAKVSSACHHVISFLFGGASWS